MTTKRSSGEHLAIDGHIPHPDGHPGLYDTLAEERGFPLVRVVDDDGRLSVEIWKIVRRRRGKGRDVMAELCGPRLPGGEHVEARRWSVTWGRLVFVGVDGEPLVPQPRGSAWLVVKAGG